ncbi:flagellar basal body P-ring formation protein FlgA [Aeromonas salmonicida subsp. achromogenes]|uniref:lateral flagellar basal body P-ring formation protein LfgA n=1 Tax=Aeromonas salmonicida TaxID=645 RepID=UPI000314E8E8|nr:lateral flagellar basal body P-ring formation protein LfgA [Aeromonas salmonicida]TMX11281.1 flagellar basal body P-ring formation protein FlgA [Aeromonas salmonicida subsp. achromogenes]TMX14413.1 flagellar basal body P-ring formation protein FlgA [Aeromonas salmonicida subsp. achromogenes]TMX14779.1 flagellar basal body P-ring formation protein FlgA [Aeromonas salmonicida subsp. achromogenes]TMX20020.1 flagellar basal body P-ring formation protein FlgA [Aeromonas salmonicida subsp. achromo
MMNILYSRWLQHQQWLITLIKGEVLFPVWKRIGLLGLLMLSYPLQAVPTDLSRHLDTRLKEDASDALNSYLQQQGWSAPEADYQVWISPAVTHLPPCQQAIRLQAGGQYRQPWGRRPYLAECTEPAWQLRARVEVTLMLPVWVTAQEIQKGQAIRAGDLVEKSLDISRLQRGFVPSSESLVGSKSTRNLRMGQLIGELDLQKAWAVREGEGVLIRAGLDGFSATTRGKALANGAIGDGIKVRNISSGKEIQTWVIDKGEVETRF